MRQLEFYEFAGILLPGTIVMAALVLLFPGWGPPQGLRTRLAY